MRLLRLAAAPLLAVALIGVPSLSVVAAGPPSLNGEVLTGLVGGSFTGPCGPPDYPTDEFDLQYQSSGSATGPYVGTFLEQTEPYLPGQGYVHVSNGVVTSFTASFSIISGDTSITGTKTLISGTGSCPVASRAAIEVATHYEATITTPDGIFQDYGVSTVTAGSAPRPFLETYVSTKPLGPTSLTLTPPDAVNTIGTSHTVTATARDATSNPMAGATIRFNVAGSTSTNGSCTTDAAGQCSFTYNGPLLPGADVISAYADANGNSSMDTGEPMAEATKAWTLPSSTVGQTTGGGQTWNNAATDKIAFGYNAQSQSNGSLKGNCEVVDPTPANNLKIKCLDVTTLVQSGTHATFFGNATVNGTPTTYRIDVDDLGEPGAGHDTFRIVTANGYSLGGTITNGNIQIHN